jgi:hypothetical protein
LGHGIRAARRDGTAVYGNGRWVAVGCSGRYRFGIVSEQVRPTGLARTWCAG